MLTNHGSGRMRRAVRPSLRSCFSGAFELDEVQRGARWRPVRDQATGSGAGGRQALTDTHTL